MNVKKAQETSPARQQQQQQGSASLSAPSQTASLNDRYGKIGISAVAGACQHKGEKRTVVVSRFKQQDSD
jgi:hypothetical protein